MRDTDADFTVMRYSPGSKEHGRWEMQGAPSFNSYSFAYACQKGNNKCLSFGSLLYIGLFIFASEMFCTVGTVQIISEILISYFPISECIVGEDNGCVATEITDGGKPSGSTSNDPDKAAPDKDTSTDASSETEPSEGGSFKPLPDKYTPAFIHYTAGNMFVHFDLETNLPTTKQYGYNNYVVDRKGMAVFYSIRGSIYRQSLADPNDREVVLTVGSVGDLKMDPQNRVIYYSDVENKLIGAYDIGNERSQTLYQNLNYGPSIISISPKTGTLLWVQGTGRYVRVMKGVLNGRSNYSPVGTYPYFNGEEQEVVEHPTEEETAVFLRDGTLYQYSFRTRQVRKLVQGGVTALALGPRDVIVYATDDRMVFVYDPSTEETFYVFTADRVLTDIQVPFPDVEGEATDTGGDSRPDNRPDEEGEQEPDTDKFTDQEEGSMKDKDMTDKGDKSDMGDKSDESSSGEITFDSLFADFKPFREGSAGKKYSLFTAPLAFFSAQSACRKLGRGGSLACPQNRAQHIALANAVKSSRYDTLFLFI